MAKKTLAKNIIKFLAWIGLAVLASWLLRKGAIYLVTYDVNTQSFFQQAIFVILSVYLFIFFSLVSGEVMGAYKGWELNFAAIKKVGLWLWSLTLTIAILWLSTYNYTLGAQLKESAERSPQHKFSGHYQNNNNDPATSWRDRVNGVDNQPAPHWAGRE